jgi:hypothetical protein
LNSPKIESIIVNQKSNRFLSIKKIESIVVNDSCQSKIASILVNDSCQSKIASILVNDSCQSEIVSLGRDQIVVAWSVGRPWQTGGLPTPPAVESRIPKSRSFCRVAARSRKRNICSASHGTISRDH